MSSWSSYDASSWKRFEDDEEDAEVEGTTRTDYNEEGGADREAYLRKWENRDCILFIIDCSSKMFETAEVAEDEEAIEPAIQQALKCTSITQQNKMITSGDTDHVGVLLYNTSSADSETSGSRFPGIHILHPLDLPNAHRIVELEKMSNDIATLQAKYASSTEVPLANVFWTAANMMADVQNKVGSKRIFLFTCNDNPNSSNLALRRAARTRAKDLSDLGIAIELFSMDSENRFDASLFWQFVLPESAEDAELGQDSEFSQRHRYDSARKFEELMVRVQRREAKKSALAHIPFHLIPAKEGDETPAYSMGVKVFPLYMEAKKPAFVWMDPKTNLLVESRAVWHSKETNEVLIDKKKDEEEETSGDMMPQTASSKKIEIEYYYPYGGDRVIFTKDQMQNLKSFSGWQPSFTLLGFKPLDKVAKPHHNLTTSVFVYPDENSITGSITAFIAMLRVMREENRAAICRYIPRKGAHPRIVALLPQFEEVQDETGEQARPAGMILVNLPYADDLRSASYNENELLIQATAENPEAVEIMQKVAKRLTLAPPLCPDTYSNPGLKQHYAALQALALDADTLNPDNCVDETMPDPAMIDERVGDLLGRLNTLGLMSAASSATPKRRATTSAAASARKAKEEATAATGAGDTNGESSQQPALDWSTMTPEEMNKMTVAAMKDFLQSVGLKPKRVKAELISQIQQYYASR